MDPLSTANVQPYQYSKPLSWSRKPGLSEDKEGAEQGGAAQESRGAEVGVGGGNVARSTADKSERLSAVLQSTCAAAHAAASCAAAVGSAMQNAGGTQGKRRKGREDSDGRQGGLETTEVQGRASAAAGHGETHSESRAQDDRRPTPPPPPPPSPPPQAADRDSDSSVEREVDGEDGDEIRQEEGHEGDMDMDPPPPHPSSGMALPSGHMSLRNGAGHASADDENDGEDGGASDVHGRDRKDSDEDMMDASGDDDEEGRHDKDGAGGAGASKEHAGDEDDNEDAEEADDDDIVLVARGGAVPSSKLLREALGEEDYLTMVILALRALTSLRKYGEAGNLISEALVSGRFPQAAHLNLLRMWAVLISLRSGMIMAAYDSVRYACKLRPHSFAVWVSHLGSDNACVPSRVRSC